MEIDLSSNNHLLHARTLPQPQRGPLGRNYGLLGPELVTLPLDYRTPTKPISELNVLLHSRQGDPLAWVAAPDSPWTAVKSLGVVAPSSHLSYEDAEVLSSGRDDNLICYTDSGYGTRQSNCNTSVFSGELHDLDRSDLVEIPRLGREQQHDLASLTRTTSHARSSNTNQSSRRAPTRQNTSLTCSICKATVRTRSEFKCGFPSMLTSTY